MSEVKIVSKYMKFPLAELHHRFIPILTKLELYDFPDPMLFSKSHHIGILEQYLIHNKDWEKIKNHPYVQERRNRNEIGFHRWTDEKIRNHIHKRWLTYRSLKEKHYKKRICDDSPVLILEKPFWETRFAWDSGFLGGAEICDGAGRCAAAMFLGWTHIPAYIAKDKAPGSCASKYLPFIPPNWKEICESTVTTILMRNREKQNS